MRKTMAGRAVGYAAMALEARRAKTATDDAVRAGARRHLADRMGKLHGLPQKIGQILGMSGDLEAGAAFAGAADRAEPLPFDEVGERLESAWGRPLDEVVSDIDNEGLAASLGQVHRAALRSGEEVAVKVAYPGIRNAVMNDLKMLGWLSAPVGDLRRGFDLSAYREEIVRDLNEELDYRTELRNQMRYLRISDEIEGLIVPTPHPRWSTESVLVTSWEDGDSIEETAHWPKSERAELARRLLRHFLITVFEHGFFHADPHPGNYRFRRNSEGGPSIVLYDFGSVAALSERDRLFLLRLIRDTVARMGDPTGLLVDLGFRRELLDPIRGKLPAVCSILFEPFGQAGKFDLTSWKRAERLEDVLGDDRWNFRMAGPAKLILLMRAFRGVLYYLERLGEPVSWERALAPILERQSVALGTVQPSATPNPQAAFQTMAKHLRLEVLRNGQRHVALTFPAASVEDLPSLMDEEVAAKIADRGIDLTAILRQARRNAYAPGELFTLDEPRDGRSFRVWLE